MLNEFLHKDKPTDDFYISLLVVMKDINLDLEKLSEFNFLDQNTDSAFIKLLKYFNKNDMRKNIRSDFDAKVLADIYFYQFKVSHIIDQSILKTENSNNNRHEFFALRNLCFEYINDDIKNAMFKIKELASSYEFNDADQKVLISVVKKMMKYNTCNNEKFNNREIKEDIKFICRKLDDGLNLKLSSSDEIINNYTNNSIQF